MVFLVFLKKGILPSQKTAELVLGDDFIKIKEQEQWATKTEKLMIYNKFVWTIVKFTLL